MCLCMLYNFFLGRITIEACAGFAYEYTLTVDGTDLEKFQKNKDKSTKSWTLILDDDNKRIVLGII